MAFAQPTALLFFFLFVPIILLYLLKQRRRRVQVSTLLFWDKVLRDEHTVASFTRLRKLLSLFLQLLIAALLILALSQPLFSRDMLGARRIVLLLDTSASMTAVERGESRFAKAKALARDVVKGMAQGDSLMLVAAGGTVDVVSPFAEGRKDLLERLATIEVTHGAAKFDDAFALLATLPPDSRDLAVYVISDGAFDEVAMTPPEGTRFAYLNVGEADENLGITAFQLRSLPGSPRDFEIFFEASNFTKVEKSVSYEVRVSDALVDAGELAIPAGGSVIRTLKQFSAEGGVVQLAIDHDDAFVLDNHAFGVLPEPRTIPVWLVTDGNLFLESALTTDDEIALETVAPANYAHAVDTVETTPRVTIFDRWAPEQTPAGNVIFLAAWPPDLGLVSNGEASDLIITDWDDEHAVNRHVGLKNISVPKAIRVRAGEEFETLVRGFDDPLVLLRRTAGGQVLVVTFDTTVTDLPLRVAYPILIANTVRYMAGFEWDDMWETPEIGGIIGAPELAAYRKRLGEHADEPIRRIAGPDESDGGAQETDDAERSVDAPEYLLRVDQAGVYYSESEDGHRRPLFAANVNSRRESMIAPSATLPLKSDRPIAEVAGGFRLGAEPWLLLAAAAFCIVALEWWLFHRRLVE